MPDLSGVVSGFVWITNCFDHERTYTSITSVANNVCNVHCEWDQSVLREVTSLHVVRLVVASATGFAIGAGLVHGGPPSKQMLTALQAHIADLPAECVKTSLRARCNKLEIVSKGDVVLIGHATPPISGEVLLQAAPSADAFSDIVTLVSEFDVATV
jgi:hypothetical protein